MSEKGRPSTSRTPNSPPPSKGGAAPVRVACGMEDCDHVSQIRFMDGEPFDGFKFDTEGWTVVEDTEEKRTVFLCTDCAREFEAEVAGSEGDGEELDEDEDGEDDDADLGPDGPDAP